MVAVADSGSKTSSQYLINTSATDQINTLSKFSQVTSEGGKLVANKAVKEPRGSLHADFPALDGPMSRILRVGRESSEAMITMAGNNEISKQSQERCM